MRDKVWEVFHEGRLIKVINKVSLFPPSTSEVLEIDGEIIKHVKGSFFRLTSTIKASSSFIGTEKEIEVRIAQKTGSIATGAQIFINGQFIFGDDSIQYPDPEQAFAIYRNGFFKHFLNVGLLRYGLPFALVMTIINRPETLTGIVLAFLFQAVLFGGAISYLSWKGIVERIE